MGKFSYPGVLHQGTSAGNTDAETLRHATAHPSETSTYLRQDN